MSNSPHSSAAVHDARRRGPVAPLLGVGVLILLGYGLYAHSERGIAVRALTDTRQNQIPM